MELNLGLQLDEDTAKQVIGGQNKTSTSLVNGTYAYNGKNFSFLSGMRERITKNDLKFNSEADLENKEFKLTETEEKVHKLLKLEHNTIDIINENIKLKEMCRFLRSSYDSDVEELKKQAENGNQKTADLEKQLEELNKELEHRNAENGDLVLSQQKRQKEFDELYGLLDEREKEIESANKYSESLLNEKKKLLGIVDQKDKKIENLSQDLYHKDQQLKDQLEDLNNIIRDLQNEKKGLLDDLNFKSDQVADLSKQNAELKKDLEKLDEEYRKNFDLPTKIGSFGKEDDLILKQRELDNLLDEHEDLKEAFNRLARDYDELKNDSAEKEKQSSRPQRNEETERELESAHNKAKDLDRDLEETRKAKQDKEDEIEDLKNEIDRLKKNLGDEEENSKNKDDEIAKLEDQLRNLQEQLDNKDKKIKEQNDELELKDKEIGLLKNELANKDERLKVLNDELVEKDNELNENEKKIKQLEDELEELKLQVDELEMENVELKANKGGFNTTIANQFDDLKGVLNDKDKKVSDIEYELQKLKNENEELRNERDALQYKVDDLEKKLKDSQDELIEKNKELNNLKEENSQLAKELDDAIRENTSHQDKIQELENANKILKADDKAKQQLNELQTQVNNDLYKILKSTMRNKVRAQEVLDILMDTEDADMNAEEALIAGLPEDQYVSTINQYLNELEQLMDSLTEEAETTKVIIRNVQDEKNKLVEQNNDLNEKYADIRLRHDNKTDMLGKLSVKVFILMFEVERLSGKS